jgi:putative glutamine amidotransferase
MAIRVGISYGPPRGKYPHYPARYGMPEYAPLCTIDAARDEHEFALLERARTARLPIFAICRGAQLLNVAHGGTMLPDLPDERAIRHGTASVEDRRHAVTVSPQTALAQLVAHENGEVNSHHHQAVDRLAGDFVVAARADDGTIEAFEWAQPAGKPYMLAVQWHPERMNDGEPFADPLFDRFLTAARAFSEVHA